MQHHALYGYSCFPVDLHRTIPISLLRSKQNMLLNVVIHHLTSHADVLKKAKLPFMILSADKSYMKCI